MALSTARMEELGYILRGANSVKEQITDEYRSSLKLTEKREVTVPTKEGDMVHCYLFISPKRVPGCAVHINIHGGGFAQPHAERDEIYSARIADAIKGIVVDIDYRLSPEYAYPAAFAECYGVCRWVFENLEAWKADKRKVSIGGQSAGATLTAAIALKSKAEDEFSFSRQVLCYGWLDLATDQADKKEADINTLSVERCRLLLEGYTGGERELLKNPYCSPMSATDDMLIGQPDTLVITAGKDNFRFEDMTYAARIAEAGGTVTVRCFKDSRHGFITYCTHGWEEGQKLIMETLIRDCLCVDCSSAPLPSV